MQIRYGSFTHSANSTLLSMRREALETEYGRLKGTKEIWDLQGYLEGASQAAITAKVDELVAAYEVNGKDIALLHDDGTVARELKSSSTSTGVMVKFKPSFTNSQPGAEYATYRTFSLTVEAEFHDPNVSVLSFQESVSFSGGGPLYGHLLTVKGPPQKQLLHEQTPYRAIQSGSAVGHRFYLSIPAPIWPFALVTRPDVTHEHPTRKGNAFIEWATSWQYQFEHGSPLIGFPNIFRG